jgi:hypothetical protein
VAVDVSDMASVSGARSYIIIGTLANVGILEDNLPRSTQTPGLRLTKYSYRFTQQLPFG